MEITPSNIVPTTPIVKTDESTNVNNNKGQGILGVLSPKQTQEKLKSNADASQGKEINEKNLEQAIEKLNKMSELFNFRLQFRVHKETGRIFCKVVNPDTGEVLREIPSEKILDMVGKMEEMAGLILDKYV
ncbi:MAG: flagellar protein FlaG [Pelotomaculum sp. PtaB.Bin104]|nr:MAG: flagellar protein FlaG [Pelotomaculum sp. PtaB.Bin104]